MTAAVVVGGSIGGLAAGIALRRCGFDVVIAERSPATLADRGAGLGMTLSLVDQIVGDEGAPLLAVQIHQRVLTRLPAVGAAGEPLRSVEARAGHHVTSWDRLYRRLASAYDGDVRVGSTVTGVDGAKGLVTWADGSSARASVVVACDGYASGLRVAVDERNAASTYAGPTPGRAAPGQGRRERPTLDPPWRSPPDRRKRRR